MNNLPPDTTEKHIEEYFSTAYEDWFDKREDELLEDFLEILHMPHGYTTAFVSVPPIKNWNPEQVKAWEAFCQASYEDEHGTE